MALSQPLLPPPSQPQLYPQPGALLFDRLQGLGSALEQPLPLSVQHRQQTFSFGVGASAEGPTLSITEQVRLPSFDCTNCHQCHQK